MCAVSMVSDHYMREFPEPILFPPGMYQDYTELLRKAKLYDEMTNQPDCPAPQKLEWQKSIEEFMREKYGLEPK